MKRLVGLLAVLLLFSSTARATWSIVVVNTRTKEVCVAGATCIATYQLRNWLSVVQVGRGGAAAQSVVDDTHQNKARIWNGFLAGTPPHKILSDLDAFDTLHHRRQYGMVTLTDPPLTYTGFQVGNANHGVVGEVGDLRFAIQGNLLTDPIVVEAARAALIETRGDLSQKVMAGMEAARFYGGDGRCSCNPQAPTSCGAPPDSGIEKAAASAFIVVARLGDVDDTACPMGGCSGGSYYLRLETATNTGPVSPGAVIELQEEYAAWRAGRVGRVDHLLSEIKTEPEPIVADGETLRAVDVYLRDIEGTPIQREGFAIELRKANQGPELALPGPAVFQREGFYRVMMKAHHYSGLGTWEVIVNDGPDEVRVYPDLTLKFIGGTAPPVQGD